jgi:hypothetical protein
MKITKFFMFAIVIMATCIGFTGCEEDEDNLEGTTWTCVETNTDSWGSTTETQTLTFNSGGKGVYALFEEEVFEGKYSTYEFSVNFTYTYEKSVVKIFSSGLDSLEGTVSGNKMTVTSDGETYVFTRK